MARKEISGADRLRTLKAQRMRRWRRRQRRHERLQKRLQQIPDFIVTYEALVNALIARRKQLGWTQLELDERAGFQSGYAAKLESWKGPQGRTAGAVTLPLWLQALGIGFIPVVTIAGTIDEQARALAAIRRPKLTGAQMQARPRR